jgi:hypothetical protein
MATTRKERITASKTWRQRCVELIDATRESLLGALTEEHSRAAANDASNEDQDLFERVPEPLHLDHGDVKFGDGKFRFID